MIREKSTFFITVLATLILLYVFFGKIIQNSNNYYFAKDGDGFKSYYGAMYHLKFDSTYSHFDGMNYPFGESVFFTDNQPLITNTVKFISKNFWDISDHIIGIINISMIISILFSVILLFLVFKEFNISGWFAALSAIGISLLSPQIARMQGHFSLSYVFWIPLILLLIIRFSKKTSWKLSLLIFVSGFFAASMHLYYTAFYTLLLTSFWILWKNWFNESWLNRGTAVLHWFVQVVLPVLLIQLIIYSSDHVSDRTSNPYGFLVYVAHPVSIFLPNGAPYNFVPKIITVFRHLSWEAFAYIGTAATLIFWIGLVRFLTRFFKKNINLKVTDQNVLNILFWTSLLALVLSFGFPFKHGFEWLIDYLGPFKQLRALSRLSWIFFYVVNLVAFYVLFIWYRNFKNRQIAALVVTIFFSFLFVEGFYNLENTVANIKNQNPTLEDKNNQKPENLWVELIDRDKFQAILPIPYFHVGSENIWIESQQNTQVYAMEASLKTGLPMTGVQLSRTSRSQTFMNYSIVTEPFEPLKILDELPSQKPFLLLFNRKHYANEDEQRLINASELVYQNENIELRKLQIESLACLNKKYQFAVEENFQSSQLIDIDNYLLSDKNMEFIHESFDELQTECTFCGSGAFIYESDKWVTVLNDTLKLDADKKYKICFWMNDYFEDAYLRSVVEFTQINPKTNKLTNYFYSDAHRHIKGFQDDWALIEIEFTSKSDNEVVKMAVKNSVLKDKTLIIDELLVYEKGLDIYYPSENIKFKNGRKLTVCLTAL